MSTPITNTAPAAVTTPAYTNAVQQKRTIVPMSTIVNPLLRGIPVPMPGALQQMRQHKQEMAAMRAKMASYRSAVRLASLQKVAAADRSAARLEALKTCAERNFVKVSEARSTLRRKALGLA